MAAAPFGKNLISWLPDRISGCQARELWQLSAFLESFHDLHSYLPGRSKLAKYLALPPSSTALTSRQTLATTRCWAS